MPTEWVYLRGPLTSGVLFNSQSMSHVIDSTKHDCGRIHLSVSFNTIQVPLAVCAMCFCAACRVVTCFQVHIVVL